jgi:hypothetical protein
MGMEFPENRPRKLMTPAVLPIGGISLRRAANLAPIVVSY